MYSTDLVVVLAVAAGIALLRGLLPRLPLPDPLLEILAGLALGPTGLGLVSVDALVGAVALLGMAFLLFLTGFEVDVRGLLGRDGRLAGRHLLGSVALAMVAVGVLAAAGFRAGGALLVACALTATSVGLIGPLLHEGGLLHSPFGRITMAAAALGQVAAVVVITVGFSASHGPLLAFAVLVLVVAIGVLAAWGVRTVSQRRWIARAIVAQADGGGQARIRFTMLAVTALALLASKVGLEAVLGAFLAGGLARAIDPNAELNHPAYPIKLNAIGFGFLIPVFFVSSGLRLDLRAVVTDPHALALVPVLLGLLVLVRGVPAALYRHQLGRTQVVASGTLLATSLPFLLVAAEIGASAGILTASQAGALPLAGLISVLVFPPLGLRMAGADVTCMSAAYAH